MLTAVPVLPPAPEFVIIEIEGVRGTVPLIPGHHWASREVLESQDRAGIINIIRAPGDSLEERFLRITRSNVWGGVSTDD